MEAGVGTLTRMSEKHVDYVLVIVEPTEKSIEVGKRALSLIDEHKTGEALVIANKVQNDEQADMIRKALSAKEVFVIPADRAIEDADRKGRAPIDVAPESRAVKAYESIINRVLH